MALMGGLAGRTGRAEAAAAGLMVTAPSSGSPTPDFAGVPRPAPRAVKKGGYAIVVGRVTAEVMPPGQGSVAAGAAEASVLSQSMRAISTSTATTRSELMPMNANDRNPR